MNLHNAGLGSVPAGLELSALREEFPLISRTQATFMSQQSSTLGEVVTYLELATLPSAPFWARRLTQTALRAWQFRPEIIETAELLVSELITNSVKFGGEEPVHARERDLANLECISLTLRRLEGRLIIEVADPDPRAPVLTEPDGEAEAGRGLMLVEILSKEWGYYLLPAGGKVVYCLIATTPGT
jgi:anti-sigma regulatory factor (Ser/Thr protein kinase)